LIVGLGNPGKDYEYTRHNIGFLAIRRLAERLTVKFSLSSLTNGLVADGEFGGKKFFLLMPLTYMNHSGVAVRQLIGKKAIEPGDILVITDDFHLPFGQVRLRSKGSAGGHNGLASVIEQVGTDAFARLRMGVGKPFAEGGATDFVLGPFEPAERSRLEEFIDHAVEASQAWIQSGINSAMEQFNKRT
jgi:PTH1 family peptidyl-tRNA hydrolase